MRARRIRPLLGVATVVFVMAAGASVAQATGPTGATGTGSPVPGVPVSVDGTPLTIVTPGVAPPGAVSPDSTFYSCTDLGYALCMWQTAGYSGDFYWWTESTVPQNTWTYVGDNANDTISAIYNHRVHSSYISADFPPASRQACLPTEFAASNLSGYDWPGTSSNMNDSISGFDILSSNPC